MRFTKTLLMTAAVAVLSTAAIAADGSKNTDGTHNANNTQTDTNMGDAHPGLNNDASADVNANASTEAEMSDTGNDVGTAPVNAPPSDVSERADTSSTTTTTMVNTTASVETPDTSTIQSAQTKLREEGHKLSVDGVWGPKTAAALRDFQKANGLSATGKLDTETLAALNVSQ